MDMTQESVGKLVRKKSGNDNTLQPKPFKSGRRFNTIKEVDPAFSFIEDDSVVECSRCIVEDDQ